MAFQESSLLLGVKWQCLILDEGHRIKNTDSKLLSKLKELRSEHKLILTGTPMQNNIKELWSMMNYLDPKTFNSCSTFLEQFGDLKQPDQVKELHKTLSPYLLRRLKEDVDKTIPGFYYYWEYFILTINFSKRRNNY
jgi:chromodomain-helicase-DNA-binding protein 7